jgi:hypothetical protein
MKDLSSINYNDMEYGYLVIPHIFYPILNTKFRFDEARLAEEIGIEALQEPIEEPFTLCECPCDVDTLTKAAEYLIVYGIPFVAESVNECVGDSSNISKSVTIYFKMTEHDCIVNTVGGKLVHIKDLYSSDPIKSTNRKLNIEKYKAELGLSIPIFKLTNSLEAVRNHNESNCIERRT